MGCNLDFREVETGSDFIASINLAFSLDLLVAINDEISQLEIEIPD